MNRLPYVELNDFRILPSVTIPALFQDQSVNDILLNNDTVLFTREGSDYAVEVEVVQWFKLKEGTYKYDLQGLDVVKITNRHENEYEFDYVNRTFKANAKSLAEINDLTSQVIKTYADSVMEASMFSVSFDNMADDESIYFAAQCLELSEKEHEDILKESDLNVVLSKVLNKTKNITLEDQVETDLALSIKNNMEQSQKEYILREKMAKIQEELGEGEEDDTKKFEQRLEKLNAPEEVKLKIKRELKRFKKLPQQSGEKGPLENYLRTMLDLPWGEYTTDDNSLDKAKEILDRDHYGMTDVKERILEYLAVRSLNKNGDDKGGILCLNGVAGVGKTSIAKSLAESLGRQFQRVSLSGMNDVSQLKGHRRTYVGAMCGAIMTAISKSGVSNPVILLDEIDKIGTETHRGSPESALLEILDPSQNHQFQDYYLDVPYDLSKVLFIATSNYLQNLSEPLKDRLEIINLNSYLLHEKVEIGKQHLLKRAIDNNNISDLEINIDDETIKYLVKRYTREGGVRKLQESFNTLCRKLAYKKAIGEDLKSVNIDKSMVKDFLGMEKYDSETIPSEDTVGLVNGLYVSGAGGGVLNVTSITTPGKGKVNITGNMKDLMKESSSVALSCVKYLAPKFHIYKEFFEENDIHLNAETAAPKDGDSAGVTMTIAMLSAITGKKVRKDVAMTGAITLRGTLNPIGGVTGKLIGALEAGCKTVIIPEKNRKDLEEVPQHVKDSLNIVVTDSIDKVIEEVLV